MSSLDNNFLWKLKLALKVKIFLWLLHRGVILTNKDNFARWNWHGNKKCCCCSNNKTIQHIFFECQMARLIWRIIHTTFGLLKPKNVIDMFGSWLQGVKWKEKNLILTGVSVVCWSIWLSRNDSVFDKLNTQSCLQLFFKATHWIRFWTLLQKQEAQDTVPGTC